MDALDTSHLIATAPQLGQLLKNARKRRKLTQRAVASRVGLSQNRLSSLERHAEDISVRQLLAWASTVGLELRLGVRESDVGESPDAAW